MLTVFVKSEKNIPRTSGNTPTRLPPSDTDTVSGIIFYQSSLLNAELVKILITTQQKFLRISADEPHQKLDIIEHIVATKAKTGINILL